MSILEKLRPPYRDDAAFGFLVLCVFLVPLAFSLYTNENYEIVKYSLFIFFTGASLVSIVLRFSRGEAEFVYNKNLYWLLAAFFCWAALSSFFSLNIFHSIFGFYYRLTNGMVFFTSFIILLLLILNLSDKWRIEHLLKILVVDALIVALVGFASAFNFIIYGGAELDGFFRGPSLLGNTDYSAMFLACIFPITLYFFLKSKFFWSKLYYALCAFWIIFIIFILASRGALLGVIFGLVTALLLLGLYRFPKKVFFTILGVSLLVFFLGKAVVFTSRPQAVSSIVGSAIDPNSSLRLEVWKISLRGIIKKPLLGVGLGNYPLFFERNRPEDIAGQVNVFDDAHNLYLHLGVTGGVPLLILFLGIVLLAFYYGLLGLKTEKDLLNIFIISSLVSWLVCVSFNPVPVPMYLLLAILLSGLFLDHLKRIPLNIRRGVKIILIIIGSAMSVFSVLVISSDYFFALSNRYYSNKDYKDAYRFSNLAYYLNPSNEWIPGNIAYASAHLGQSREQVESIISRMKVLRKGEADSLVITSNVNYLLYQIKGDKNDLASAITNIQKALVIDPYFAERYGQLALYQYQSGQLTDAKLSLFKELGLSKEDFSAWILLAKVYQQEGNKMGALASLERAFAIHPDSSQLKYIIYIAKKLPDIKQVPIPATSPQI